MAFKLAELFVEIKAKNAKFKGAMAGMRKSLSRMNVNLDAFARKAKRAFLIVGAAAVAGAVLVVKAAVKQRDAEFMLAAALNATGHQAELYMGNLKAAAAQIQKNTIYGDEFVLDLMAQGLNLGVTGDKIEGATKSAIGLAIALKMDLQTSMRYATLAMQGEFTMLRRYIPALRQTEDAVKQLAIIQKVAAGGYEQAKEYTKTAAGQYAQLKNEIGDTAEKIGSALIPALNSVLAALKKFMVFVRERIDVWVESWAWAIYTITNWKDTTKLLLLEIGLALETFVEDWKYTMQGWKDDTINTIVDIGVSFNTLVKAMGSGWKDRWTEWTKIVEKEGSLGFVDVLAHEMGRAWKARGDKAFFIGLSKEGIYMGGERPEGGPPGRAPREDTDVEKGYAVMIETIQRGMGGGFAAFLEKMRGGMDKVFGMRDFDDPDGGPGGKTKGKRASFVGLAEAWKKIQLGIGGGSPEERAAKTAERSLSVLKEIAANTRGPRGGIRDQSGITQHPLFNPNLILTDKN